MTDIDFSDLRTIATVDTYNLFSLVGMEQMSAQDQASVAMDLQMLIWSEFITQRLPLLLTQAQLEHIRNLVVSQQSMTVLMAEIEKFVPSFKPLWLEFSLDFKYRWVKNYWQEREKNLQESFERTSQTLKPKLKADLQRANQAVVLANAGQWTALIEFLNSPSSAA